jgi:hypothetical protein
MFLKRVSKRAPFRNPFECYTDYIIGAKQKNTITHNLTSKINIPALILPLRFFGLFVNLLFCSYFVAIGTSQPS